MCIRDRSWSGHLFSTYRRTFATHRKSKNEMDWSDDQNNESKYGRIWKETENRTTRHQTIFFTKAQFAKVSLGLLFLIEHWDKTIKKMLEPKYYCYPILDKHLWSCQLPHIFRHRCTPNSNDLQHLSIWRHMVETTQGNSNGHSMCTCICNPFLCLVRR